MLKYLKSILHLVKNLGGIFGISSPLVKFEGIHPPHPLRDLRPWLKAIMFSIMLQ